MENAYSALFYSIPVANVLILPIVMAVLASRLWDMEVKGSTWKLLYTLQSRRSLFLGKALFGTMEVVFITFLEMGGTYLTGKIYGYTEEFPVNQFLYLTACTLMVELLIFFGAFLIMILTKNPLPALCAGIVASLICPVGILYSAEFLRGRKLGADYTYDYLRDSSVQLGTAYFYSDTDYDLVLCIMVQSTETGGVRRC